MVVVAMRAQPGDEQEGEDRVVSKNLFTKQGIDEIDIKTLVEAPEGPRDLCAEDLESASPDERTDPGYMQELQKGTDQTRELLRQALVDAGQLPRPPRMTSEEVNLEAASTVEWPFTLPDGSLIQVGGLLGEGAAVFDMTRYIGKRDKLEGNEDEQGLLDYHLSEKLHIGYGEMTAFLMRLARLSRIYKPKNRAGLFLEVGAGTGILTKRLGLQEMGQSGVVAVELDKQYADFLHRRKNHGFSFRTRQGHVIPVSQFPPNVFIAQADGPRVKLPFSDAVILNFSAHHLSHIAKIKMAEKIAQMLRVAFLEKGNQVPFCALGEEVLGTHKPRNWREIEEILIALHAYCIQCSLHDMRSDKLANNPFEYDPDIVLEALGLLGGNEQSSLMAGLSAVRTLKSKAEKSGVEGERYLSPADWIREGRNLCDESGELKVSLEEWVEIFEMAGMILTVQQVHAPVERHFNLPNDAGVMTLVFQLREQVVQNGITYKDILKAAA